MDLNVVAVTPAARVDFLEVMLSVAQLGRVRRDIENLGEKESASQQTQEVIALIDGTFAEIHDHLQEVLSVTS